MPRARQTRVLVRIDAGWRPTVGDGFDAVVAALDFAGVPAVVIEHEGRRYRSGNPCRRELRGTVTSGPERPERVGGE